MVELLQQTNNPEADAAAAGAPAAGGGVSTDLLHRDSIVLDAIGSREEAITRAGELLVARGAVSPAYVDAMHEREASVSTYMGNLLAIPHGTNEAKSEVNTSAISFVRYPDGVEWKGKEVKFVIGIAATGNDHLKLLGQIAEIFLSPEQVARLEAASTVDEVLEVLGGVHQPA